MTAIRRSEQSKQDIREIAFYIATNNNKAARRFVACVEDTYKSLALFPQLGHTPYFDFVDGLLTVPVSSFGDYAIFYRFVDGDVRIDRVAHGSRDLPKLFKLDSQ